MRLEKQIETINEHLKISDGIKEYIILKASDTGNHLCDCPFCKAEDMFVANDIQGKFNCFSCKSEGDIADFVSKIDNLTLEDACKQICKTHNIPYDVSRTKKEEEMIRANNLTAKYYFNSLKGNAEAKNYLKERGLSEQTIKRFGIGCANTSWTDTLKMLKTSGFKEDLLLEVGLISKNAKAGNVYDKFTDRIMFPIIDENKDVVGFSGRLYKEHDKRDSKYFNSPQSDVFNKSNVLYGINHAVNSKNKAWVLCEGQMDVIASHQYGYDSTVASSGTSLTKEQARKISHYTNCVYIAYDNDAAGVKAKLRAIPMLRNEGLKVKIIDLAPYKDPDELLKNQGKEYYNKKILEAKSSYEYELSEWYKDKETFKNNYEKAIFYGTDNDVKNYQKAYEALQLEAETENNDFKTNINNMDAQEEELEL